MTTSMRTSSEDFFEQGDVWVAPVWAVKDNRFKPRPVVIVGNDKVNDAVDVVANFITTQGSRGDYDVEIIHWQKAGLNDPSWARTSKPITVAKSQLRTEMITRDGVQKPRGYIGKLDDIDLANILEMCKAVF